jgi:hypothetical protein
VDCEPAEARLEPFETELLEQPTVVGHGPAPFEVVVATHGFALAPKAAGHPVSALDDIGPGPRLGDTDAYFSSVLRINAVLGSCVPRRGVSQ